MVWLVQTYWILLCCIAVHANKNDCQYHCYLYTILSSDFTQFGVSFWFNILSRDPRTSHRINFENFYEYFSKKYIAVVPLVQYITGFCVSFAMKPLAKHLGKVSTLQCKRRFPLRPRFPERQSHIRENPSHMVWFQNGTFFLGAILTITASIWGTILDEDMSYFGVYILGFLFGAGTTTVLVQSLAITAELIGENTSTSAFVYGAMSLTGSLHSISGVTTWK